MTPPRDRKRQGCNERLRSRISIVPFVVVVVVGCLLSMYAIEEEEEEEP